MSGFQFAQHASATYTNYYPSLSGSYKGVFVDHGMNIADHHGVGITYTGDFTPAVASNEVLLNYNYQFQFKNLSKLSVGSGIGIGGTNVDYDKLTFGDPIAIPEPGVRFELNLGIAYHWKNLFLGFSSTNLTAPKPSPLNSYYGAPRTGYNAHAQYAFQIANKFQLTPRILYSNYNGFQELRTNLTLTYNQKFSLGVNSESRNTFGVNIGGIIKNKVRITYMYSSTVSKLNNGAQAGVHEASIGFMLNNSK